MVLSINEKFIKRLPEFKVVGTASSAQEALKQIDTLEPDLLLLDVFMPQETGLDILRRLRHEQREIDVILVTAAQDAQTVSTALRLGAVDYIIKPYDFSRLKQAFEAFLLRRAALSGKDTVTQHDLDQLTPARETPRNNEDDLPKGLDEITLQKVVAAFRANPEPLSTDDLAQKLNLSRITVRRYLEYLEEQGRIIANLKYNTVGRPTRIYSLL